MSLCFRYEATTSPSRDDATQTSGHPSDVAATTWLLTHEDASPTHVTTQPTSGHTRYQHCQPHSCTLPLTGPYTDGGSRHHKQAIIGGNCVLRKPSKDSSFMVQLGPLGSYHAMISTAHWGSVSFILSDTIHITMQ